MLETVEVVKVTNFDTVGSEPGTVRAYYRTYRTFLDLVSNPRLHTSLSKCIYDDSHELMLYSTVITQHSRVKMHKTCRVILGLGNIICTFRVRLHIAAWTVHICRYNTNVPVSNQTRQEPVGLVNGTYSDSICLVTTWKS